MYTNRFITVALMVALVLAAVGMVGCGDGSDLTARERAAAGLNADGTGPAIAPRTDPPAAPTDLRAFAADWSRIDLSWTYTTSDEDGFRIYMRKGSGWSLVISVGPGERSCSVTGLRSGRAYTFKVVAYNAFGKGTSNLAAETTMALIPAGCFNMGDAFDEGNSDELPVHQVCLTGAFSIDAHLVTNADYALCVAYSGCTAPSSNNSNTRYPYYTSSLYQNFPVIQVSLAQAAAFCAWNGKRLPTEAEWEYAARGGLNGKRYPNGNTVGRGTANYYYSKDKYDNDTTPVEFYPPNGYGIYDMAGNAWEMVSDWYAEDYYSVSPTNNPTGPATGTSHVVRGGAWDVPRSLLRVSARYGTVSSPWVDVSFRCAE